MTAPAAPDAAPTAAPAAAPDAAPAAVPGCFRSLWWWEAPALRAHLGRLSPRDLNLRFHGAVSGATLDRYAADPMSADRQVIGWFHDGALRGAADLRLLGDVAEAAFTVEEPWRRMGVGAELMRRALRRAANRGAKELIVHTNRSNRPMVRLARGFDAALEAEFNEVEGRIPTPAPGPASYAFDAAQEEMGLADAIVAAHRAAARRFWTGGAAGPAANADEPAPMAA